MNTATTCTLCSLIVFRNLIFRIPPHKPQDVRLRISLIVYSSRLDLRIRISSIQQTFTYRRSASFPAKITSFFIKLSWCFHFCQTNSLSLQSTTSARQRKRIFWRSTYFTWTSSGCERRHRGCLNHLFLSSRGRQSLSLTSTAGMLFGVCIATAL